MYRNGRVLNSLIFTFMNQGKYVFAQFMELIPQYALSLCIDRYSGEKRIRSLSCYDQFLVMSFGQLTSRESLRSTMLCLDAHRNKLYHLGFRGTLARRTLSDANEKRNWRIYQDFALILIAQAQKLYGSDSEIHKDVTWAIYALDSTTIDLCMSLFPWATFRTTKSAVKMHTLLDIRTSIPTFISITEASCSDVNIWPDIIPESWAWYIVDRGYIDFCDFYRLTQSLCFFVTRAKKNVAWKRIRSRDVSEVQKKSGIRCDQIMRFTTHKAQKDYLDIIRRIKYFDEETEQYFIFMTNNMTVDPIVIAQLYKSRWQVELFFKWIKQHLCIQTFWGFSENAVKTQIWIAVSTYVLAAILKKHCALPQTLYEILQILWVSVFDKSPISSLFLNHDLQNISDQDQTSLF